MHGRSQEMRTVTLSSKGQIAIPKEVRATLHIEEGDQLVFNVVEGKIVLEPVINVPRSQAWFWTKEIQNKMEKSEKEFIAGKSRRYKGVKKLLDDLNGE